MNQNTVEILDVVRVAPSDSELLLGYAIDKPKKGKKIDGTEIEVLGWIVGKNSPAVAVEVINNDRVLRRISVDEPRQDVGKFYPDVLEAKNSGFMAMVDLVGLSETDELLLQIIWEDESKTLIGRVEYQLHLVDEESEKVVVEIEEKKSPIKLEEIEADLERSRAFLKKMQKDLEQMEVGESQLENVLE